MDTNQTFITFSDVFLSVFTAGIASIATALITYNFAIRRHRSERLWELKSELYRLLIQKTHKYIRAQKTFYLASITCESLCPEFKDKMQKLSQESYDYLLEAIDSSDFIISKKASVVLAEWYKKEQKLSNDMDSHRIHFQEYYETAYVDAEELLKEIVVCAKSDLKR